MKNNINTRKILVWKTNGDYLDIGKIQDTQDNKTEVSQILFTDINSVDNFNQQILNFIKLYDKKVFDKNLFELIKAEDITGFIISEMKWRKCKAYLVIQTSKIGYRYLCYFYDKIFHSAECFGTSYRLVEKSDIITEFNKKLDKIKSFINFDEYPELKDPILRRDYETKFGIS